MSLQLSPLELSKLPSVPATEPGVNLIGYDQDNPARMVRVPAVGILSADPEKGKLPPDKLPTTPVDMRLQVLAGTNAQLAAAQVAANELVVNRSTGRIEFGSGVSGGRIDPLAALEARMGAPNFATVECNTANTAALHFWWDLTVPSFWRQNSELLVYVTLGARVNIIGEAAFASCPNLTEVIGPDVVEVRPYAFSGSFGTVRLPKLQIIGDYAFATGGANLVSADLVYAVGMGAFAYNFPPPMPSLVTAGPNSFADAVVNVTLAQFPSLTTIQLRAFSVSVCQTFDHPLVTSLGPAAFEASAVEVVNAPAVTLVGDYSFQACSNLRSVNLPAATTVGGSSFMNCIHPDFEVLALPSATSIGEAFLSGATVHTLYLACPLSGLTTVGDGALFGSSVTTIYVKPGSVGWVLGPDQTIAGKSGITVASWTNWPNV